MLTIYQLAEWVGILQNQRGVDVVVASGFYNPLHLGHIRYLEASRRLGGQLVVVVNTDEQVRLKGAVPFMPEGDRLAIVSALKCVDYAVLAVDTDRTVCRTLSLLNPRVFANGGDVSSEADCREAEVCRKLGIRMEFGVGGSEKLRSSSELIRSAVSAR